MKQLFVDMYTVMMTPFGVSVEHIQATAMISMIAACGLSIMIGALIVSKMVSGKKVDEL